MFKHIDPDVKKMIDKASNITMLLGIAMGIITYVLLVCDRVEALYAIAMTFIFYCLTSYLWEIEMYLRQYNSEVIEKLHEKWKALCEQCSAEMVEKMAFDKKVSMMRQIDVLYTNLLEYPADENSNYHDVNNILSITNYARKIVDQIRKFTANKKDAQLGPLRVDILEKESRLNKKILPIRANMCFELGLPLPI